MQPVLSPDGKWLAVLLTDGLTTDIWAQPTSGGPMRRITDFWPSKYVHHPKSVLVVGWALYLRSAGKRRG